MPLPTQTCANHPDRPGRAVCMNCRKTVCSECATQWDGINYCVDCLKKIRKAASERTSLFTWAAMLLATVILFAAGSFLMVWSASLLAKVAEAPAQQNFARPKP